MHFVFFLTNLSASCYFYFRSFFWIFSIEPHRKLFFKLRFECHLYMVACLLSFTFIISASFHSIVDTDIDIDRIVCSCVALIICFPMQQDLRSRSKQVDCTVVELKGGGQLITSFHKISIEASGF